MHRLWVRSRTFPPRTPKMEAFAPVDGWCILTCPFQTPPEAARPEKQPQLLHTLQSSPSRPWLRACDPTSPPCTYHRLPPEHTSSPPSRRRGRFSPLRVRGKQSTLAGKNSELLRGNFCTTRVEESHPHRPPSEAYLYRKAGGVSPSNWSPKSSSRSALISASHTIKDRWSCRAALTPSPASRF